MTIMTDDYALALMRVALAQVCQNIGFHSGTNASLAMLLDVCRRHMETMCKTLRSVCDQFGRTEPTLEDLQLVFSELRVLPREIGDYLQQVGPVPFCKKVAPFPVSRPNKLKFPIPDSKELQTRPDYIPYYLPLLQPETMENEKEVQEGEDSSPKRANAARVNAQRPTVHGKQSELLRRDDLLPDFSDFDAVKAGLVKLVRLPTSPPPAPPPPPPPPLPPQPAVQQPSQTAIPVASSGALSPTRLASFELPRTLPPSPAPGLISAPEEKHAKKRPPSAASSVLSSNAERPAPMKLKLNFGSVMKKKHVLPAKKQKSKRPKNDVTPSKFKHIHATAATPRVTPTKTTPPPKHQPKKPSPVKVTPAKMTPTKMTPTKMIPTKLIPTKLTPTKVTPTKATPAKVTAPVTKKAQTPAEPPKKPELEIDWDLAVTPTEMAEIVTPPDGEMTAAAMMPSCIEELVTSVIEETRDSIRKQQVAKDHFADSVDLVVARAEPDVPVVEKKTPPEAKKPVEPTVTAPTSVAKAVNHTKLKSILSKSRLLINKDVIKQRLQDKAAKKDATERQIREVVQKTFAPIAEKSPVTSSPARPVQASRGPPGLPPTSQHFKTHKPEKHRKSLSVTVSEPKPKPPTSSEHRLPTTKSSQPVSSGDSRKVAPLVISTKPKPEQTQKPEPPASISAAEPLKLGLLKIKLPLPPPSSSMGVSSASAAKDASRKHKRKHHEKEQPKLKVKMARMSPTPLDQKSSRKEKSGEHKKRQTASPSPSPVPKPAPVVDTNVAAATAAPSAAAPPPPPAPAPSAAEPKGLKLTINLLKSQIVSSSEAGDSRKLSSPAVVEAVLTPELLDEPAFGRTEVDFRSTPPPKSPSMHSKSPSHSSSVGGPLGDESPPPPTPSPRSVSPTASPIYVDVSSEKVKLNDSVSNFETSSKTKAAAVSWTKNVEANSSTYNSKRSEVKTHVSKASTSKAIEPKIAEPKPVDRKPVETKTPVATKTEPKVSTSKVTVAKPKEKTQHNSTWYCPICNVPYEEGGPDMIGCDGCDDWYHWTCVGLTQAPPDDENWYCPDCRAKRASSSSSRQRKQTTSFIKKRHK